MIEVVLQNDYNKQKLKFPCSEEDIRNALLELQCDIEVVSKVLVHQVEEPEELKVLERQVVDLDELNYLAKRMESFWGDSEFSQFYEATKYENFTNMKDLINLTFNLNRYPLIQDISDMSKVGREYILMTQGAIPANDEDNPKYAEKGRELIRSGKGVFTEHGLLFVNDDIPFADIYDGEIFPFYLCDSNYVMTVIIEYNGKQELLSLPCEELAIQKVAKRLKVPDEDALEVKIDGITLDNSTWMEKLEDILKEQGIYNLNLLAHAFSEYEVDYNKLSALINYADTDEVKDIVKLIEQEEKFYFFDACRDYDDVGKKIIEDDPKEYMLSSSLEDYIDYELFGRDMSEWRDGRFVEEGFVCMKHCYELSDVLGKEEQEIGMEMKS